MSILQEYEEIKKYVGIEKWNSIDTYIKHYKPNLRLDQIIYNSSNWIEFENWFNKEIKLVNVNVIDVWKTDYDDFRCLAEFKKGQIELGNIIASYDENTIRNLTNNLNGNLEEKELKNAMAVLVASDFDKYSNLPKISNCSKLLIDIYDNVVSSDASMCHIDNEDWKYYLEEGYTVKDILDLAKEIKKNNLEDVIEIDNGEYKIIGYSDLETKFIDDREISSNKEIEM